MWQLLWKISLIPVYCTSLMTSFDIKRTSLIPLDRTFLWQHRNVSLFFYHFFYFTKLTRVLRQTFDMFISFFLLYLCLDLVGKGKNEWQSLKKWMIKENKICSIYNNKKPHTGYSHFEEKLVTLIFIKIQIADHSVWHFSS